MNTIRRASLATASLGAAGAAAIGGTWVKYWWMTRQSLRWTQRGQLSSADRYLLRPGYASYGFPNPHDNPANP